MAVSMNAESDTSDAEIEASVAPPPPRRARAKPDSAEDPEEIVADRIQCDEAETVPLVYVPCINGVLKTTSSVVYGGKDWIVSSLEYDGGRKKPFANLTSIADEDVTMRLPTLKLQLNSADYLKTEVNIILIYTDIQKKV